MQCTLRGRYVCLVCRNRQSRVVGRMRQGVDRLIGVCVIMMRVNDRLLGMGII